MLVSKNAGYRGAENCTKNLKIEGGNNRFLINPSVYGTERPKIISSRPEWPIQSLACKQKFLSQIKNEIQLSCTSRTIIQVNALLSYPNVVEHKLKGIPPLSKRHVDSRINVARKHLTAGTNWNDMCFWTKKCFI
ncbi:hypothetical protein AVEN_94948-1 [Araneus ventricosus]|uniref:Uncharacterized protein n=1 Tax=Araneus ventricosus TaxID=182803 RepID=A0A4Y2DIF1_ARAVE|nr:hypothetical protein AVEN_94948-1 [Araneus ventricosus]